jgi:predicted neuraminidase
MRITVSLLYSFLLVFTYGNARESWVLKEEFLSPERDHFDCHSSDIVETAPGCFCAVWKGGPGDGKSNIDIEKNVGIWLSLYTADGWSEPKEIVRAESSVCWNPVLCPLSEQEILLFFRIGPDPRRTVSFLKRSFDGGHHWTKEEILPAGIVGPTKCRPIVTSVGTLLCPSSVAVGDPEGLFKATAVWIDLSEDGGRHWKKIGPLELPNRKFGVIEPTLFYDHLGRLRMLCRDRANKIGEKGFIWAAVSIDEGLSWSEFEQTSLPNPDSGIATVDLGTGKIILLYNHSHVDRYPLNLAISLDGGEHWSDPYVLDASGEFPAGFLAADGGLHITYAVASVSGGQRRIKHVIVDLSQLPSQGVDQ